MYLQLSPQQRARGRGGGEHTPDKGKRTTEKKAGERTYFVGGVCSGLVYKREEKKPAALLEVLVKVTRICSAARAARRLRPPSSSTQRLPAVVAREVATTSSKLTRPSSGESSVELTDHLIREGLGRTAALVFESCRPVGQQAGQGAGQHQSLARREGCQPWRLGHPAVAMQRTKGRAWTFMALSRGERERALG